MMLTKDKKNGRSSVQGERPAEILPDVSVSGPWPAVLCEPDADVFELTGYGLTGPWKDASHMPMAHSLKSSFDTW